MALPARRGYRGLLAPLVLPVRRVYPGPLALMVRLVRRGRLVRVVQGSPVRRALRTEPLSTAAQFKW